MSEIDYLLEPISETQPTGPDLRLEPADLTFETLKEFSASVSPEMAESDEEIREPNWGGVVRLCISALQEKSKDLELITSLCEGWVRTEGIEGLEQGVELLQKSLERYWPNIHPGYDPEDGEVSLALRARWLNWMDSHKGFLAAIKAAPIVQAQGGEAYSWSAYENSAMLDDATITPERRAELLEAGVISSDQWKAALGAASPMALREGAEALGRCASMLRATSQFLREKFSVDEDQDAPDLYNLVNLIEEIQEHLAKSVSVEADAEAGVAGEAQMGVPSSGGGAGVAGGPIANRAQALRQLQEVGDYFRRAEPHSPISYLITRAVKWGTMSLDDLLRDVVRNDDVIEHIWETLGLDSKRSEDED